jgi:RNA 2',3'-cyclic 3'-phosphodiesterase
MRLFTAITFQEELKTSIYQTVDELKNNSKSGSFTIKDNLHLTLNFIGETNRLEEVKQAMIRAVAKTRAGSFMLTIRGVGRFNRREGDICWIGVEEEQTLWRLQKQLVKELKEEGFFDVDDRYYKPHLTLGRKVLLKDHYELKQLDSNVVPMNAKVTKISLMNSERLQGKLVYTEIFKIDLSETEL